MASSCDFFQEELPLFFLRFARKRKIHISSFGIVSSSPRSHRFYLNSTGLFFFLSLLTDASEAMRVATLDAILLFLSVVPDETWWPFSFPFLFHQTRRSRIFLLHLFFSLFQVPLPLGRLSPLTPSFLFRTKNCARYWALAVPFLLVFLMSSNLLALAFFFSLFSPSVIH